MSANTSGTAIGTTRHPAARHLARVLALIAVAIAVAATVSALLLAHHATPSLSRVAPPRATAPVRHSGDASSRLQEINASPDESAPRAAAGYTLRSN